MANSGYYSGSSGAKYSGSSGSGYTGVSGAGYKGYSGYYKPQTTYYEPQTTGSNTQATNDYLVEIIGKLPVNTKYLFNPTNGFAYNSFADVLLNKEAHKKRWGELEDTPFIKPVLRAIDTALLFKDAIIDPVKGSIEMANESQTDDFTFSKGLTAGLSTAVINTLIHTGNSLDIFANPIKGAILEGRHGDGAAAGFIRGLFGDAEYGRKQYDYSDYGYNFAESLVLEFISDPVNLITLGTKGGIAAAAKSGTTLIDDALGTVSDTLVKGITKEVVEEVVPEFGEAAVKKVASELGEEAAENAAESVVKKSITRFVLDNGADAVDTIKNSLKAKGFEMSDDTIKGMLEAVVVDNKFSIEAFEKFSKSAKSSAAATFKRFAKNPELAKNLLNDTGRRSVFKKVLGLPDYHKLPDDVGEAVYRQLTNDRKLRSVASGWADLAGYKWTPATQTFAAEALQDVTLDQLPGLARLSKLYNAAEYVDALTRNAAFRSVGADILFKGATKIADKGLGYMNNLKAIKQADAIKNTTDWLIKTKPEHAVDFSKHGDVIHVTYPMKTANEATDKIKMSLSTDAFKRLDTVLNEQRDALLSKSFLNDDLDVTGLQKIYSEHLEVVNKTIAETKAFKDLNLTNLEELVKYLNQVETDDAVVNRFIKKLNNTYTQLYTVVDKKHLDNYLEALKSLARQAQYKGTSTVTDNLAVQNIISTSGISKTISAKDLRLGKQRHYDAVKKLTEAKKELTPKERKVLLSTANALASDKMLEYIEEINRLLDATYKNYPGASTKAALLGTTYDEFFEAVTDYKNTSAELSELLKTVEVDVKTDAFTDTFSKPVSREVRESIQLLYTEKLGTASKLTAAYDALYKHLNRIDFTADTFKQAVGARPELKLPEFDALLDTSDVAAATDKAYTAYDNALTNHMLTANIGNVRLNTLEGYVRSLNELPKEVFSAQARLNSVDIDALSTHRLVGYVLGLSKRGLLMSLLEGDGTTGAYFAKLLDDYDDTANSTLRALLDQDFDKGPVELTTYGSYDHVPLNVIDWAISESGAPEGSEGFKEFLADAGYIKKSTIVEDISIYKNEYAAIDELLDRLSKTRKLLRNVREVLNQSLDKQYVECFIDEFISKGLEAPNALLPENIGKTIEECFTSADVKFGAYLDTPKLTQDYMLGEIKRIYNADIGELSDVQRIALAALNDPSRAAHDALNDVENWIDAFVKLDETNHTKLKKLTADGRYVVVLDTETTGLLDQPSADIYQIAAKIIDADGNQIAAPIKLRLKVSDLPDPTVLNKLFDAADPAEITALKNALNVNTVSAETWFTSVYINRDHPFYYTDVTWAAQKDLTNKKAFNELAKYITQAQELSHSKLCPVIAGHNIKEFDIQMLYNKAYTNTHLKKLFEQVSKEGLVFDTLDTLQHTRLWKADTALIDSYIPQLSNIILEANIPNTVVRRNVIGFSDVQKLSEFKQIFKTVGSNVRLSDVAVKVADASDKIEALDYLNKACTDMHAVLRDPIFEKKYSYSYEDFEKFSDRYISACGSVAYDAEKLGADSEVLLKLYSYQRMYSEEIDRLIDAASFETYFEQTKGNVIDKLKAILEDTLDEAEHIASKNGHLLQDTIDAAVTESTKAGVLSGTLPDIYDAIDAAIDEVNNQWRAVSKLRGASTIFTFSKAGLDSGELFKLWEQGLVSVPGWRNIMSMLLHNTDATDLVMLNPRTAYSYVFENFYDKALIKEKHGSGTNKRYVSSKVLERLTKNSQRMSRIKKGILPKYIRHHYTDAHALLTKALELSVDGTKHMYDLEYVNLKTLPKANLIAYTVANYNDLQTLFKFYKDEDALRTLEKFKDFDSLYNALPEVDDFLELDAHSAMKYTKMRRLYKTDDKGNLISIFTGRCGDTEDVKALVSNAGSDAAAALKAILQHNNDRHLHTATSQANAYLYRQATGWHNEVDSLFKSTAPEQRAQLLAQINSIDVVYSNAALDQFLNRPDAPIRFIEEARLSAGRKAFFSKTEMDLSSFTAQGIITKVIPVSLEDGTEGYLHLFGVPMSKLQDIFVLKHQLNPTVLKELNTKGVHVVETKFVEDEITHYKYVFNDAAELSKELTDAKVIDNVDVSSELKHLVAEWRYRDAACIKNISYSNGDVLTIDIVNKFDELLGVEANTLVSTDTLKAFGYFDDLKANNLVIGTWGVQSMFNKYACSDFIRRHAYNTVNYIDTQLTSVTRYLNMLCNDENGLATGWLKDLDSEDLYKALKNNKDFTLVYVRPSKKFSQTASGLVIEKLAIINKKSIDIARSLNAHIVPTYSAYTMMQAVNTFKLPKVLNVVSNLSMLYKIGYLSSVGWLMRNIIDSNYKNHLDFKDTVSVPKQVMDFFNTMQLVMDYTNVVQSVGRNLDNAFEYKALYLYCTESSESLIKLIKNDVTLTRYVERFKDNLSDEALENISKHLIDVDLFEVTDLFIKNGPSAGVTKGVVNSMPTSNSATQKFVHLWTERLPTKVLFNTNEFIEQAARLQSYLYSLQHGASLDEAVARVLKTHFDYSDKSLAMMYTELIFPFMSFSFKNLEYWIDALYANGFIAGELENILRCVFDYHSLFNPDYEVYRNYDYSFDFEKDVIGFRSNQPWQLINASRLYHMLSGNLVWDTGKDVLYNNGYEETTADLMAVFKLSPSILDAIDMLYMPLDQFQQRMLPPYEVLSKLVTGIFTGDVTDFKKELSVNGLLNNLPFVGAALQRTGLTSNSGNNILQRVKDAGLYQLMSSLFTAAYVPHKEYNTWYGENDEYLTKLPNKYSKKKYPKNTYYKKYYSRGYSRTPYTRSRYYRSRYNKTFSRQGGFTVNYSTARRYQSLYDLETPRYKLDMLSRSPYYKDNYQKSKKQVLRTTQYSSLTYNVLKDNILKKRILDKYFYYT